MVSQQLEAVVSDIGVDAIKTGMLYSSATIAAIISSLSSLYPTISSRPPIVVDPVCVSTSGHSLFPIEALDSLRNDFFPHATVITPNVPEGELLAGLEAGSIKTVEDMLACAKILGKMGARWVYLKGGHLPLGEGKGKHVVDVLWDSVEEKEILSERPFLEQKNTHGTGCTLSSAIAAELAKGKNGESSWISRQSGPELTSPSPPRSTRCRSFGSRLCRSCHCHRLPSRLGLWTRPSLSSYGPSISSSVRSTAWRRFSSFC